MKGFTRNFKPLDVLTEEQVDAIWRGVFEILETTGLKFDEETPKALRIFDRGGCKVDYDSKMVKFPPGLIEELIRKCPSSFHVEARDPKDDLTIGGNTLYVQPGPGMWYWDMEKLEPRMPTRQEFIDAVRVYDALPNLHFLHSNCPNTNIEGVHPVMSVIETYAERARHSTKAQVIGPSLDNDMFNIEIAKVVGAKGMFYTGAASPLGRAQFQIDAEMRAVEAGLPVSFGGGSLWGATAPTTIAGEIVTNIAESIGALALAQLMNPGHSVMMRSFTFPQNMKSGAPAFGNITIALAGATLTQCWRRYRVPVCLIESCIPNSKCIDFQGGYEKGMLALAHALAGASCVWLHGTIYGELTAHPIQAIMDDDIAGMIGRFLEGVKVNDETLAVNLIKEVGPIPGFYLGKEHTRKWWKREQYIPAVADGMTLQEWLASGKKTILDHAKEKMEEILATHKVSIPLTPHQEEEIGRILTEARKYYQEKMEA